MELFIQIRDGNPHDHPIMGDNFRQAFPNIDTNNLPPEFARFERVPCPSLVYANLNNPLPSYQWEGNVVKDVWDITFFTPEQIQQKQNKVKELWAQNGYSSWIFNETTCSFDPPIPYPADGKFYYWDESSLSWVEAPTQGA